MYTIRTHSSPLSLSSPFESARTKSMCKRGAKGGHAEGDWLTAEAELKDLKAKAAAMLSTVKSLTETE